jgi:hypothetical protein
MQKLIVGKVIEQEQARCNWCGEEKECFKSLIPSFTFYWDYKHELEWLRKPGLFQPKKLYWVRADEGRLKKEVDCADICSDCVKQLSKI